jgi:hypothetical protein
MLRDALGQEVELSITGPQGDNTKVHKVMALRTPEGLARMPKALMVFGFISQAIKNILAAFFLCIIATFVSWQIVGRIIGAVIGSSSTGYIIGFILGLLVFPFWLWYSFRDMYQHRRARTALN